MSLPHKLKIPDFRNYQTCESIRKLDLIHGGLSIEWTDGRVDWHYALWLRENSPDESTTHPLSREQKIQLNELPDQVDIASVSLSQNHSVDICWKDEALVSSYDLSWLRYWGQAQILKNLDLPERILWHQIKDSELPYFSSAEISEDRTLKLKWAEDIHRLGFGIIRGVRPETGVLEDFLSTIGPVRASNFGRIFDVRFHYDPRSNAYTNASLPVHTDLCTREELPGIQWLHCLEQSVEGGLSILCDGFAIANLLKQDFPEDFDALTNTSVSFINKSKTSDFRFFGPVIKLDKYLGLDEIRLSPWLRGPVSGAPNEVRRFYKALKRFIRLSNMSEYSVRVRLEPGDLLAFDNKRLLHGRTRIGSAGSRWLRGCYMDRDDLHSLIRMQGHSEFSM